MTTSPIAPTANGRRPCLRISRKLVRRPTPANVRRNAQRERFASAVVCSLVKKWYSRENRNQQEAENELRKFLPEECGLVPDHLGLPAAGPVNRIGEHDEADHRVARGLRENGQFAGRVGVKRTGGSGFGGVVDREPRPQAVGVIAEVQRVANQRKREERQSAEREDGSNRERGVFVVGFDGALRGDNGADAADSRPNRKERSELGMQTEGTAEESHERNGHSNFDGYEPKADTAKLQHITEEKARAEQHDAGLEPKFVSGHARA